MSISFSYALVFKERERERRRRGGGKLHFKTHPPLYLSLVKRCGRTKHLREQKFSTILISFLDVKEKETPTSPP